MSYQELELEKRSRAVATFDFFKTLNRSEQLSLIAILEAIVLPVAEERPKMTLAEATRYVVKLAECSALKPGDYICTQEQERSEMDQEALDTVRESLDD